eukprot:TRINITY_DN3128_c0_g5_i1.p2 TRINITY_DN3128_c0_g5~~TRINITY_DN3128_c0_g5_i1.p2  ORF type:complete len:133 (+),score=18.47 TRINITY_DN3128_c0_g5_i1:180-578(+)
MVHGRGNRRVAPNIFRIGLNRNVDSYWYSSYYYKELLSQDIFMHKYLQSLADHVDHNVPTEFGISRDPVLDRRDNPATRLFIQRMAKRTTVFTFACTPVLEDGFSSKKRTFEDLKKQQQKSLTKVSEEEKDE